MSVNRMHFYELSENRAPGDTGAISAASKWFLPGVKCPGCGATWANAAMAYPCVDLSQHPQQAEFVVPRPAPLQEFERLRELIRPLAPEGAPLPPGTRFGPLVGKAWGRFGSFFFQNPWTLLVRREAMEALQQAGIRGLAGRKPELSFRQKNGPPELMELQLMPYGMLHAQCLRQPLAPCSRCGRDGSELPEQLLLDAASLPTHMDVFRLADFESVLVGNERFKEAVQRLGLDGILFQELPLR
ncbi:double-CXXCG motif protein [Hyalangium rubrum]|uniref:Double-CXXCG motif protein n=1 Tax=Hyalangium rubrum TaxID=3103134 RepID=A0ABU5H223_9BACT|nr:double-CXXCG motif protein [Hyalangium sp. s54d21]MDY7227366.1 double-CXXCG motif protein [Hyalangium sp. s54d21]